MIISSYNNPQGNRVSLTLDFDKNYFPVKYIVDCDGTKTQFPGTKKGAADANRFYKNRVSICEKRNLTKKSLDIIG